jgi:two-component system NtrC family sensor kinase
LSIVTEDALGLALPAGSPMTLSGASQRRASLRPVMTLRAKGVLALVLLLAYVAAIGVYVVHQRERLLHVVAELDYVHHEHELVTNVGRGLRHSVSGLETLLNSDSATLPTGNALLDVASLLPSLPELSAGFPHVAPLVADLEAAVGAFEQPAASPGTVRGLRNAEQRLAESLEGAERQLLELGARLTADYRAGSNSLTAFIVGANMVALAIFGIGVTLFFSRLAADLRRLEGRAMAIVGGYRGAPLSIGRHDEVGRLIAAVNHMQAELREREQQEELRQQQRFHEEKMAAVGSLAAGVAHEVANPINSISGIAQHTLETLRAGGPVDVETLATNAALVIKQAERVGAIVRQIADLSAPRSPEPELLNLNELVRGTCSFIRYDHRFRHIELRLDLDPQLPAVLAVADHLTQVLMNLLINAADALEDVAERPRLVCVTTRVQRDRVRLGVTDNGHGMGAAVLAQAFERSFTTKPVGRGRGIGLYLCRTLVEEAGGRLTLDSTVSVGTSADVSLPVPDEPAAGG